MGIVMKGSFKMVKNMERVLLLMKSICSKASLEMIISFRGLLGGLMETVTMVIGRMGIFRDRVLFMIQRAIVISMEISAEEIGIKATG